MAEAETTVNNDNIDPSKGLEDISLSDDNEDEIGGEETECDSNYVGGCNFDDANALNGVQDLWKINMKEISAGDLMRYHFVDLGVAFMFYNWYASSRGFAGRKSKVVKNTNGDIIQQIFVCHRQGFRRLTNKESRKRQEKWLSRCGCDARCKVHVDGRTGRWYFKYLNELHNHSMMDEKYTSMLPAHRKITEFDKFQMNKMREVGIKTPHIFGWLASNVGGFDRMGFQIRDIYNENLKDKGSESSDAKLAIDFLRGLRESDGKMYWRHTVDESGRLQHLFWCDGVGQVDYSVFGDVLAFDATYKKNKYLCPLVVFSGVNHHNQSIVFASAIVGNETEETYIWVLEQFLTAMGGKSPVSVITDGDMAMRNAIKRVFPNTQHRLCAWHLLRNATSNVKKAKFVPKFKHCMLGDYDIREFELKWEALVIEFGLQDNMWVKDLYEKRNMWATAYLRGKFFGGFRTTSRCEGLHSEFGKYVNGRTNLVDFLKHFFRWLKYMRYREVEADFKSVFGKPVLQTQLEGIEKSAADVYTKEVFMLFRPILERAMTCRVDGAARTHNYYIYAISRYMKEGLEWHVSYCPSSLEFKCSCMRQESFGIPCEHLIAVMMHLDIVNLPDTVVYKRWTKCAKDYVHVTSFKNEGDIDPALVGHYVGFMHHCKRLAESAFKCGVPQHIRDTIDILSARTEFLDSIRSGHETPAMNVDPMAVRGVMNPTRVRTKGCGGTSYSATNRVQSQRKERRAHCCRVCGNRGHNRLSCPVQVHRNFVCQTQPGTSGTQPNGGLYEDDEDSDDNQDYFYANVDMAVD